MNSQTPSGVMHVGISSTTLEEFNSEIVILFEVIFLNVLPIPPGKAAYQTFVTKFNFISHSTMESSLLPILC